MSGILSAKFEIIKFDGTGNFGLWQRRVKDLLVQQGMVKALLEEKPESMEKTEWKELEAKALWRKATRNAGEARLGMGRITRSLDPNRGRRTISASCVENQDTLGGIVQRIRREMQRVKKVNLSLQT